ncbi:MAG: hypothetical protein ACPG4Z_02510 [Chitinophagales bacterium]
MKKIITILALIVSTTLLFANYEGESSYESSGMSYNVERSGGQVYLYIQMPNAEQYSEVQLYRSDNMTESFKRIKYLNADAAAELGTSGLLVDKYPLPARQDAYYKIVTTDANGVQKTYPAVVLESGK